MVSSGRVRASRHELRSQERPAVAHPGIVHGYELWPCWCFWTCRFPCATPAGILDRIPDGSIDLAMCGAGRTTPIRSDLGCRGPKKIPLPGSPRAGAPMVPTGVRSARNPGEVVRIPASTEPCDRASRGCSPPAGRVLRAGRSPPLRDRSALSVRQNGPVLRGVPARWPRPRASAACRSASLL